MKFDVFITFGATLFLEIDADDKESAGDAAMELFKNTECSELRTHSLYVDVCENG